MKVNLKKDFKISLDANPTTGYMWEVSFDGNFLKLKEKTFQPSTDAIGSSGKEIFTFIPIQSGETKIILRYKRPWESKVLKKDSLLIKIKE